ncbi:MAG: type VI secretion system protein TssA [Sulfuricurvum sp.]|nr:type VI secretion system protein TssA [Sulfuricurvum sp.]
MFLSPISTQFPCGIDAKYDDDYLSIESEIDKMNSLTNVSQTNWQFVNNECASLLVNRTKDLKLLSWWGYAQYKLHDISGFSQWVETINMMLESFGKDTYPKSGKGKWGALTWLEALINQQIIKDRQILVNTDDAESLLTSLRFLQLQVKEVCDVTDNLFPEACRLLEIKVADKNRQLENNNEKTKSEISVSLNSNINGEITSDADAIRVLNQLKKSAEYLCQYWRYKKTDDIRALRLTRMISWLDIDGLPQAQNGKTMINPPSIERVDQIDTYIAEGKNDEAIQMIENVIFRSPFWFYGHYKAFNIFNITEKNQAAYEIKNMLVSFINSNEGIMNLTFRDGTPFIPSEIKEWINEYTYSEASATAGASVDTFTLISEQCYELVNKKKSKDAMEILQSRYSNSGTQKEKFKWRFLHAQIALSAGKPQMTLALINELEKDIDRYRLEEWQPELVAKVYDFYLNSFNRTQLERDKYDAAFQQLCRVDIAAAIDIK